MRSQRRKQRQPRRQHISEGCLPKETRWPNPETPASNSSPTPTTRIERAPASRSSLGLCMPLQSNPDHIIRWKMFRCPHQHTTPRQKQDGMTARDGCSRCHPRNTCSGPSEDTHEHHPPMGSVAHAVEVPASAAKPVPRRPPEEGARLTAGPAWSDLVVASQGRPSHTPPVAAQDHGGGVWRSRASACAEKRAPAALPPLAKTGQVPPNTRIRARCASSPPPLSPALHRLVRQPPLGATGGRRRWERTVAAGSRVFAPRSPRGGDARGRARI
jgi:hypothetical protein